MSDTKITTEEKPEAAAVETADETVEPSASNDGGNDAPDTPRGRLSLLANSKGRRLAKISAILTFVVISTAAVYFLREGVILEAPAEDQNEAEPNAGFDSKLNARELIELGNGAIMANEIDDASRFLEAARIQAEVSEFQDVNLTVDVFEGLAKVAEAKGKHKIADIYRGYAEKKQAELGSSLPLFNSAEKSFRATNLPEARKYYAQFLLTKSSLSEKGQRYIVKSKMRIASIQEMEFKQRFNGEASESVFSMEDFFNED